MAVTTIPPAPPAAPAILSARSRHAGWTRVLRGRPDDPWWARPGLFVVLAATGVLYLWGLAASGWGNTFYAAAVQAGTKSWKALFFGSFDASNFITVDKPPGSLWVMELSARVFGLSSWSLLVPQALEGVATVAVVYAAVRRWFRPGPALLAGAVTALTPVAALMFRYNNPDALLVLVLTIAGYATMRAIDSGRTRWLVLAGALVGFGFLTKELQTLLVVPAIGLAYLVAGPPRLGRRVLQLLAGGVALVVAAGWWVAAVQLTPAADRPYIGGSQDNSLWNVIFGYNGFGRLTGNESGSVLPGANRPGPGMWGPTGWERLFQSQMGGQISWLLPASLLALVAGLWWTRRQGRTGRQRAALLLWGGSLLVTGVVISFSQGIIHPYYTIALAPLIGITLAIGLSLAWDRRQHWAARAVMAVAVLGTAIWSAVLLDRTPSWYPWLRVVVLATASVAAVAMVAWPALRSLHLGARPVQVVIAGAAVVALLGGSAAYTGATVASPEAGAIPSAGPAGAAGAFGFGGGRLGGRLPARFGGTGGGAFGGPGAGGAQGAGAAGGGLPGGGAPLTPGALSPAGINISRLRGLLARRGGGGGLFGGGRVSPATARALKAGSSGYTWMLATTGAESGAPYQLATGEPIMAIGGFNGTDPAPTLAQFETLVSQHRIHYFLAGGGFGAFAGVAASRGGAGARTSRGTASSITAWVEAHFQQRTVGGLTVYDLTAPK